MAWQIRFARSGLAQRCLVVKTWFPLALKRQLYHEFLRDKYGVLGESRQPLSHTLMDVKQTRSGREAELRRYAVS